MLHNLLDHKIREKIPKIDLAICIVPKNKAKTNRNLQRIVNIRIIIKDNHTFNLVPTLFYELHQRIVKIERIPLSQSDAFFRIYKMSIPMTFCADFYSEFYILSSF